MNPRTIKGCFATAVALIAVGCASNISTIRYGNVPAFPPTAPASAARDAEEALRTAAAGLGANAVVLVVDLFQPANVASRSWWKASASTVTGRDVIGVAIRYR